MKVEIRVTQKDIDNGCPWNGFACPIHRAISRRLNRDTICHVSRVVSLTACKSSKVSAVHLPPEAIGFIGSFDRGYAQTPLRFTIDIPAKFLVKGVPGGRP